MSWQKLDDTLKTICSELGDPGAHRYAEFYLYTGRWLETVNDQRLGGVHAILRLPVDDRRVWLPQGFNPGTIGVNVQGSLSPLLENNNMIDDRDDCGVQDAPETGNPDWPRYNLGDADLRISYLPPWPGQGGGQSIRGYYRHFKREGYILLDSTCEYTEIYIEGATPSFVPGVRTWVESSMKEAIMAFIEYEPLRILSKADRYYSGAAEETRLNYVRAMRNLRSAKFGEPLQSYVSAVQSRLGQIGV